MNSLLELEEEAPEEDIIDDETGPGASDVDIIKDHEENVEVNAEPEQLANEPQILEESPPAVNIITADISKGEPSKRSISPIRPPVVSSAVIKPISPILPPATIISPIFPPAVAKVIIQRDPIPEQPVPAPVKPVVEMTMQARADLLRQKLLQEKAAKPSSSEKKPRITRSNLLLEFNSLDNSGAIIANINRLVSSPPNVSSTPAESSRGSRGGRKAGRGSQRGRGQRGTH